MLGKWCSCSGAGSRSSSRLANIKKHLDGIQAAVERGLANGRHEGLNNKVRLIIRAYVQRAPGVFEGVVAASRAATTRWWLLLLRT